MKSISYSLLLLILLGCGKDFEPQLNGWKAFMHPSKTLVYYNGGGGESRIVLPGDKHIGYRYVQWTKLKHQLLVAQLMKTAQCDDYQILTIDTTGAIIDTVYKAPPNTPINFKLAPNDSLLLVKTYYDDCEDSDDFKYTFFNRYSKTSLADTIIVKNARGIPMQENVWSPDSKKVIISEYSGRLIHAFTYDIATKDTTYIDKGTNFIWSPSDQDLVAYIKDHSIYSKNIKTGEKELLFKGKKKKSATAFRWNPTGEFLMIHVRGYLLNVESNPLQTNNIIYFSMKEKNESRVFYDGQRIDTWMSDSH